MMSDEKWEIETLEGDSFVVKTYNDSGAPLANLTVSGGGLEATDSTWSFDLETLPEALVAQFTKDEVQQLILDIIDIYSDSQFDDDLVGEIIGDIDQF